MTSKYELHTVRSQLLEFVRDAYPETFEELPPSGPLGESAFSGPTPHPNEVLNLFIQQELTSALPTAYYMLALRGIDSLTDGTLPRSAILPSGVLRSATLGLIGLRELELNQTNHLIYGSETLPPCSTSMCLLRNPTGPEALDAYRKVSNHIVGSHRFRTKLLQVPEFYVDCGGELQCVGGDICRSCVEKWEFGHADLRRKVWAKLPEPFRLKG